MTDLHSLEQLSLLCRSALCSSDATQRQTATEALRYLSHSSMWGKLQELMNSTQDEFVLFVCCKALLFIVNNEIGPGERDEAQQFLLTFVAARATSLPQYVTKSLLNVYAAALYLNWRMMVITLEEEELGATIGERIYEKLAQYLPPYLQLYAMTEVLHHFTKEDQRSSLMTLREAFATRVLPFFFSHATKYFGTTLEAEGWTLIQQSIDFVPPSTVCPLVGFRITTEETLYATPLDQWYPGIQACYQAVLTRYRELIEVRASTGIAMSVDLLLMGLRCCRVLANVELTQLQDARATLARLENEDVAPLPTVDTTDFVLMNVTLFAEVMAKTASQLFPLEVADEALRMMCNCYERQPEQVTELLAQRPEVLQLVSQLASVVTSRWNDEEEGLRSSTLMFLSLLVEHYCSPNLQDPLTAIAGMPQEVRQQRVVEARQMIAQIGNGFLMSLLTHCYLHEGGSVDLSTEEGLTLFAEKLIPLVRLILLLVTELEPAVLTIVRTYCNYYEWCLQLKEGHAHLPPNVEQAFAELVNSVDGQGIAVCMDNRGAILTSIILSRLATLFLVVGLLLKERTTRNVLLIERDGHGEGLIGTSISFITNFLCDDKSDSLLSALAAMTTNTDDQINVGRLSDTENGSSNDCHQGVLRAIIYLAAELRHTVFSTTSEVITMSITAIKYILGKYSMFISLGKATARFFLSFMDRTDLPVEALRHSGLQELFNTYIEEKIEATRIDATVCGRLCASHRKIRKIVGCALASYAVLLAESDVTVPDYEELLTLGRLMMRERAFIAELAKALATGVVSPDNWQACCLAIFCDLRGYFKSVASGQACFYLIAHLLEAKDDLLQILLLTEATFSLPLYQEFITLLRKMTYCCHKLMDEGFSPYDVGVPFASFTMHFCVKYLSWFYERRAVPGGPRLPVKALCEVGEIVHHVFHGGWCNVGVMSHYGDYVGEELLLACLQMLLELNRQGSSEGGYLDVMSLPKHREFLFRGIQAAQSFRYPTSKLQQLLSDGQVIRETTAFLVKCLHHTPLLVVLETLCAIVENPFSVRLLAQENIGAVFKEVTTLISTGCNPTGSLGRCIDLLMKCHLQQTVHCELILEELLDLASAFHRVRLRCLLMMLRSPPADPKASFSNIFSVTSRQAPSLTAW